MATIINTPPQQPNEDGSASGIIVGVILAIVIAILFIMYGLPAIRQQPQQPSDTNIIVTPPACTNDTWNCTGWSACYLGRTTRSCTMTYDCPGVSTPSPTTEDSCSL